jgi:pSer/pThr/pTyr-binding forkhead associated (FHA) protein
MLRKLSIRLREAERRIESLQTTEGHAIPASRPVPPPPAKTEGAAGKGTRLEVEGDAATFAIEGSETLIGRYDPVTDLRPDADLTQVDLKRSVSRRHARIVRTGEGWVVTEEVGALNGTFVNGAKLVTGRPHPLADGDRLGLGMVKLVFRE